MSSPAAGGREQGASGWLWAVTDSGERHPKRHGSRLPGRESVTPSPTLNLSGMALLDLPTVRQRTDRREPPDKCHVEDATSKSPLGSSAGEMAQFLPRLNHNNGKWWQEELYS